MLAKNGVAKEIGANVYFLSTLNKNLVKSLPHLWPKGMEQLTALLL